MRRRLSAETHRIKQSCKRENTKSGGRVHSLPSLCFSFSADWQFSIDGGFFLPTFSADA